MKITNQIKPKQNKTKSLIINH